MTLYRTMKCPHCEGTGQLKLYDGAVLRAMREQAKMSLREFAKRLGFSPAYISDIELGKRRAMPAIVEVYKKLRRRA